MYTWVMQSDDAKTFFATERILATLEKVAGSLQVLEKGLAHGSLCLKQTHVVALHIAASSPGDDSEQVLLERMRIPV